MPVTTLYSVKNLEISEIFTPNDTFAVQLMHKNIIEGTVSEKQEKICQPDILSIMVSRIRAKTDRSVQINTQNINYYPIYATATFSSRSGMTLKTTLCYRKT